MSKQIYEVHVFKNGSKHWFQNNRLHREDGPAIEYANGDKFWYQKGQRHREDGPASECTNGDKYWYLKDISFTKEEFDQKMSKRDDCTGKIVEIDGKKYELRPVT